VCDKVQRAARRCELWVPAPCSRDLWMRASWEKARSAGCFQPHGQPDARVYRRCFAASVWRRAERGSNQALVDCRYNRFLKRA
jgi:hypothetical protein